MMYSQGLKKMIAARSVVQLLIGSSNRAVTVGIVNQGQKSFSIVNTEQVR